ncbi:predicted protein [Chaetomium globosum CBS 148.51]|uniref:Uncharacterized protein n=1 Tax=Chaetomium globosum (strain ATCC 6205 / CBS 148.51 / DSM 1962 / NBRC 6347 / NRRL 1970) TaxID=306901 RepID=Q2GV92_CHAGB|nr:uncharacterized protein CHGG_08112 [Chaetomium globosum CBS 148.51]EAQ86859.1 predicted protein [Chaetomium globosum CBS 148.51]
MAPGGAAYATPVPMFGTRRTDRVHAAEVLCMRPPAMVWSPGGGMAGQVIDKKTL